MDNIFKDTDIDFQRKISRAKQFLTVFNKKDLLIHSLTTKKIGRYTALFGELLSYNTQMETIEDSLLSAKSECISEGYI
ncbi:MAG: hypothetical protein A2452_06865 [Candidatus Firestonebacteria bacterium RIFOXYC2_FULL_39_67]|nr:MAG: hypothetical protein A2452_06865 [Candidatus Firestonebacteria bacterium RIFOXYC2_FULL_39_67]